MSIQRAISCAGYVAKGVGIAVAFSAGIAVACAVFIGASIYTARILGLHDEAGPLIMIGYMILVGGVAIGIGMCWENSR